MASADNASLEAGRSQDPGVSWPGSGLQTDPRELAETVYLLRKERDLWVAHFEQLLKATELNHASLADFQRAASRISDHAASESRRASLAVEPFNVEPQEGRSHKKDSLEVEGEDEHYVLSNPSQELIEEKARNAVLQGDLRAANLHTTIVDAKVESLFERLVPKQTGIDSGEAPESFVIRRLNAIEEAFIEKQIELEGLKKGLETATRSLEREQETLSTQRSLGESLETRTAGLDTKLAEVLHQLDLACRERDQSKEELVAEQKAYQSSISQLQVVNQQLKQLQDQLKDTSELRNQLKSAEAELEQLKSELNSDSDQHGKAAAEIETLKQQNLALEASLAEVKRAGNGLTEANQAFQESVSALKGEITLLRNESQSAADTSAKLAEKLQTDLSLAQDALSTASERAQTVELEFKNVSAEKQALVDKVATLEAEKAQLNLKYDGLQEELSAIKDGASKMKAEYESCLKDLQQQIDSAPKDVPNYVALRSELEGQKPAPNSEVLLKDLESLKVEVEALRGQLEMTKSESEVQLSQLKHRATEAEDKLMLASKDVEKANLSLNQSQSASQDKIKALDATIAKQVANIEKLKSEKQDLQNELGASQCQVNVLEQMLDQQKADSDAAYADLESQMEKVKAEAAESIGKLFARIVELEESKKQLGRTGTMSIDESEAPKPEEGDHATKPHIARLENKLSFDNMTFDKHSPDARSIHSSKFISVDNLAHKLDQSFGQAAFEDEQDESKKFKGLTLRDAVDKIDFLKSEITRLHDVIKNVEDKMAATLLQHSSIEYGYKHEIVGLKANYSSLQEELRQSRVDKAQLLLTLSRIENPTKDLDSKKVVRLQKEIESLREQLEKAKSQSIPNPQANPETEKEQEAARTRIRRMQGALQLEAISYSRILEAMHEVTKQVKQMGRKLVPGAHETEAPGVKPSTEAPELVPLAQNKLHDSHLTFSETDQDGPEEAWSQRLCQCREALELIAADLAATLDIWLNLPADGESSSPSEELVVLQHANSSLQQQLESMTKELDRARTEQVVATPTKAEQVEDASTAASLAEDLARANVELAALRSAHEQTIKFKTSAEQLESQLQEARAQLEGLKEARQKIEQLESELVKLRGEEAAWDQNRAELQRQAKAEQQELQDLD